MLGKKCYLSNLNQEKYLYYDIALYSTSVPKELLLKHADTQIFTFEGLGAEQPGTKIELFKPASFLLLCLQKP